MGFIKCPRCELNYIREEEQYCPVCKREMKGESHNDPFELCSICNENPVMPRPRPRTCRATWERGRGLSCPRALHRGTHSRRMGP